MHFPSRGGVRGGSDQFEWESVKIDKHRENYLGHSLMAPVGRWQKGKDLTWYTKGNKETKTKQQQELSKVKQLEEEAMAAALGFGTVKKKATGLTKQELAETLKRGQTERDSGNVERVEGMGFGSSRAAMMDSGLSNKRFVKEPESKSEGVNKVPIRSESVSEGQEEKEDHTKRKKKKKHKAKKLKKKTKDKKTKKDDNPRNSSQREDESDMSEESDSDSHNDRKSKKIRNVREEQYDGKTNRRRERHDSVSPSDDKCNRRNKYKDSDRKTRQKTYDSRSPSADKCNRRNKYKDSDRKTRRRERYDSGSSNEEQSNRKTSRRRDRHDSDSPNDDQNNGRNNYQDSDKRTCRRRERRDGDTEDERRRKQHSKKRRRSNLE